jgi:hypothetical protein
MIMMRGRRAIEQTTVSGWAHGHGQQVILQTRFFLFGAQAAVPCDAQCARASALASARAERAFTLR